jgi:hypothetical protein
MSREETLWQRCLKEEVARALREGRAEVRFADVDRLIVEMSMSIREYSAWPPIPGLRQLE